jgi:replicative DNA helicase
LEYKDLYNPQAESGVISTLIHNPTFIFHSEELEPRDFYDQTNQAIYWAIRDIALSGNYTIDDFSLTTKLASNKAIEARVEKANISSVKDILELSKYAAQSSVEAYKDLVKDVQEYSSRRKLYLDAQKIISACVSEKYTSEDLQHLLNSAVDNYDASATHGREIISFDKKVDPLWQRLEDRHSGKIVCRPFHIKELNEYTQMEDGEMVVIGGHAKTGKSALLLSCTVDLLKKGETVLVIDSELSDDLYFMRLLSHLSEVKFRTVKDGGENAEERIRINEARDFLKTAKLYHEFLPICDKNEIASIFRRVNNENRITVLVIDYFKADFDSKDAFSTSVTLTGLVNFCKNEIAGVYKIPILAAVQTSQTGNVSFSSGVITALSTLCWLHLKEKQEILSDTSECGNAKLTVLYNRNGAQMQKDDYIDLQFDGDIITYRSPTKQHIKTDPY